MKQETIKYQIEKTNHGIETIIVSANGKVMPLHSKVNPEREADLFKNTFDPGRFDLLIMLGVGLGYHLIPLQHCIDQFSHIILVDILRGIDKAIARNPLTSFILRSPNVTILMEASIDELVVLLSEKIDMETIRGISVLEHPSSMRIFPDYYGEIKKTIEKVINIKAGNKATRHAFGKLYVANALKNIGQMQYALPVRNLFNSFSNFPALVVASGPSLEHYIDPIKANQEKFFIITVDSALPVLCARGIRPDIVISIDPQPYVLEHFNVSDSTKPLFVYSLTSHPSTVRAMRGYVSLNSHPLSQLAMKVYGEDIGSIDSSTGMVTGDAVNLCLKCGFTTIGVVGLDFSFSDYMIYARGTAYQKRSAVYFQNRVSTVEGFNSRYIFKSSGGYKAAGKYTRKSFMHYKQSFEDFIRIKQTDKVRVIGNHGLSLSGILHEDFEVFMRPFRRQTIDKKLITSIVKSDTGFINTDPLINLLVEIQNNNVFDEILTASLGGQIDEKLKNRYRNLIARMPWE